MPNILITGGSGQIGMALSRRDWPLGHYLYTPDSSELDLSDEVAILDYLEQTAPFGAIINCAAYTAVDSAEGEPERATAINADAPFHLACYAEENGIPFVHVSTDYVFGGDKDGAYVEDAATGPLNVYGASKLAGEQAVRDSNARAVILRTAWVLSPQGNNFIKTMLKLASERDEIGVVADQTGSPTSAADIAQVLQTITLRLLSQKKAPTGTYHFVNAGETSWHGLAAHIFGHATKAGLKTPKLNAITTVDYPTPAQRPVNSRLDSSKIARDYKVTPRPWQDAIDEILDVLVQTNP